MLYVSRLGGRGGGRETPSLPSGGSEIRVPFLAALDCNILRALWTRESLVASEQSASSIPLAITLKHCIELGGYNTHSSEFSLFTT